jgi:hypothetical protein
MKSVLPVIKISSNVYNEWEYKKSFNANLNFVVGQVFYWGR